MGIYFPREGLSFDRGGLLQRSEINSNRDVPLVDNRVADGQNRPCNVPMFLRQIHITSCVYHRKVEISSVWLISLGQEPP